jgi:hypothetical protein
MEISTTIEAMRRRWGETIRHGGGYCPVCTRWGSIYKRGINRTMARSLIWLNMQQGDEDGWVDVPATGPKDVLRTNQLSTLKWWGLIQRKPNDDPKKRCSGIWRVTDKGKDFISSAIRVPKYVYTYNDEVAFYGDETVALSDCFLDNFDYREVMGIPHGSDA